MEQRERTTRTARDNEDHMCERACSRRRWISRYIQRLTHRFREHARSHKGLG